MISNSVEKQKKSARQATESKEDPEASTLRKLKTSVDTEDSARRLTVGERTVLGKIQTSRVRPKNPSRFDGKYTKS